MTRPAQAWGAWAAASEPGTRRHDGVIRSFSVGDIDIYISLNLRRCAVHHKPRQQTQAEI